MVEMFFQFFKKKYWTVNIIGLVWESNPKYSHPFYMMGLCQDEVCAGGFVHVNVGEEWGIFIIFCYRAADSTVFSVSSMNGSLLMKDYFSKMDSSKSNAKSSP